MEVTSSNFSAAVDILKSFIHKADFIAIDGEFTGLSTLKSRPGYDTMEEKYSKVKQGSSQFLLIQYGICLFIWNADSNNYEAMSFTFYIYPRPYKRFYNDVMFMCQSSSLDYLANNGFDFNKLFYQGISFMSPWEQEKAEARLAKELAFASKTSTNASATTIRCNEEPSKVFIPKDQQAFITDIKNQVELFANKDSGLDVLDLKPCSAFQRKLIYEVVEEKYPMGLYLESAINESKEKFIKVVKISSSSVYNQRQSEKYKKEVEMMDDIIGFTKVIKMLTDSKRPLIGHNMFLDLFFTVSNFFAKPPEDLEDYKLLLNSLFPVVIDTKLISTTPPLSQKFSGTSLKKLMESVEDGVLPQPNVVDSKELNDFAESSSKFHQAGYDAYCTGCSFISLSKYLLESLKLPAERIDISSEILQPFVNRVNILGIKDIKYMNLTDIDKVPDRKAVFHVSFPAQWKEQDLEDLFSPVCSIVRPTVWLSNTSAYVTIKDKEKYGDVIDIFVEKRKRNDEFCVQPYEIPSCSMHTIVETSSLSLEEGNDKSKEKCLRKRKRSESEVEEGELKSDDDEHEKKEKVSKLFDQPDEW